MANWNNARAALRRALNRDPDAIGRVLELIDREQYAEAFGALWEMHRRHLPPEQSAQVEGAAQPADEVVSITGCTPKEIRRAAHVSQIAAAVGAGVSEATLRIYEADRGAVNEESRARLDAFYARCAHRGSRAP